MDTNEQFFHVVELRRDLEEIDARLQELSQMVSSFEASGELSFHPESARNSDERKEERTQLNEQEAELLELRDDAVSNLGTQYLQLVGLEADRLDTVTEPEGAMGLANECFGAVDTVIKAFMLRVVRSAEWSNDIVEPLIQLSEGLPLDDVPTTEAESTQELTRIGPDAMARYIGINLRGRRLELVDVQAEAEAFLLELERLLEKSISDGREENERQATHARGVEFVSSPRKRKVWRRA